jgi:hypothetical protein
MRRRASLASKLHRLWTYKTRPGVLNFLMGWFKAKRPESSPPLPRNDSGTTIGSVSSVSRKTQRPFSDPEPLPSSTESVPRRSVPHRLATP